jgi:hypothetical protein
MSVRSHVSTLLSLVKFDIEDFYMKICQGNPDSFKIEWKYWEPCLKTKVCSCRQQYTVFCSPTTMQRQPIFTFLWQHSTVLHCWQWHMQCSSTKWTHCCFPMARMVTRVRHSVLLYIHCLSCYIVHVALNVSLNFISVLMHWKAIIW